MPFEFVLLSETVSSESLEKDVGYLSAKLNDYGREDFDLVHVFENEVGQEKELTFVLKREYIKGPVPPRS